MSSLDATPRFSLSDAAELARSLFAIEGEISALPSERDQNFKISTETQSYVFKIANAAEDSAFLEAQNAALTHLQQQGFEGTPQLLKSVDGQTMVLDPSGRFVIRLLQYLEGVPLGTLNHQPLGLLEDIGARLGQFDQLMADFDHAGFHRDFHWDLAKACDVIQSHRDKICHRETGILIDQLQQRFQARALPLLETLPKSVIHNDANDYNVIVQATDVLGQYQWAGLIDFGDMVHSHTIGNLAIAIAYAVLDKDNPLAVASALLKGYHQHRPVSEAELSVLFNLVTQRLCASAAIAAEQQAQDPDNDYLGISQAPIQNTLPRLAAIADELAEVHFRHVCGYIPCPNSDQLLAQLTKQDFAPVLDTPLTQENCALVDLSVTSALLSNDDNENAEAIFTQRMQQHLAAHGASVGVGRFDEARTVYQSDAFNNGEAGESRTIHLGIDLFAPAGTPVYAPEAGVVHLFNNNTGPLDYGPVIILQHQSAQGQTYYTLYGHLSVDSLDGLTQGQHIERGQAIARLGDASVNGGWSPHLHFQLMVDLLDMGVDFPGVAAASQREAWTALSPDPNVILRIPEHCFGERPRSKAQTLNKRRQRLGNNLSIAYRDPVKAVRGHMQYLYDEVGRRYLDSYNNVPHVGHCHPEVIAAAQRQMSLLATNTRYLSDDILDFADTLCATLPEPLEVCYFLSSASEANELAMRLARAYTQRKDMIVLEAAYHGITTGLIDISPYKHAGPGGSGRPDWVHVADIPDVYRGAFGANDPLAGEKYAASVGDICQRLSASGRGPAAFIAESNPSVGGQIVPPAGYLQAVYQHVRQAGGLCIADEVQTGYGRTGESFYAFEQQGVVPDMVILGKPIGNGHPLAALITTRAVADAFDNGMEFFATFGGNTVSSVVGKTVLDITLETDLQNHAKRMGARLLSGLQGLVNDYEIAADARGSGLFLGLELVKDRQSKTPAAAEASLVTNRMRELGVLMGTDGPYHNVVKIRPPLAIQAHDVDFLVEQLQRTFKEHFA